MCWLSIQTEVPGSFWITITLLFTSQNQGEDQSEILTVFEAHYHFFKVKFEPEVRPSMRLFPLKSARMILQIVEKANSRRQCLCPSRFHVSGSDRRRSNGSSLACYYVLWFSII
jgi:hypothetical protein